MSEIRMRAVHPACTVSAEQVHRLALGVLDAVRALRSAFSERHPSWIRSEDGTWYVVIMAADRFDDWRRAAAPPVHVPGAGLAAGLSATVDPDGTLRSTDVREVSLGARARDLVFRDDTRLAEALAFAEQCQGGSGPWCRHADALLKAVRSHFGTLAVPARAREPWPRLGQADEIEGCE